MTDSYFSPDDFAGLLSQPPQREQMDPATNARIMRVARFGPTGAAEARAIADSGVASLHLIRLWVNDPPSAEVVATVQGGPLEGALAAAGHSAEIDERSTDDATDVVGEIEAYLVLAGSQNMLVGARGEPGDGVTSEEWEFSNEDGLVVRARRLDAAAILTLEADVEGIIHLLIDTAAISVKSPTVDTSEVGIVEFVVRDIDPATIELIRLVVDRR